jgi:hypothetical protein
MIKNKYPWFLLCSQLWMGRRTYHFLLLKFMLTLSLIPLAFCSTYPKTYILSATIDYKSYYWVNWFKARFSGSWLRRWSFRFLCNLSFASIFYLCIVSSHTGSFANLAGYPPFKPTSSFVLTPLDLPITWVWRQHVTKRCFKGKIQVPSHKDIWYLP